MLHILHKRIELLNAILLCFLHFLDTALHLADVVLEIAKPPTQAAGLPTNQIDVPLVHFLQLFELVALVSVAKEAAVRADWHLASLAEVVQG